MTEDSRGMRSGRWSFGALLPHRLPARYVHGGDAELVIRETLALLAECRRDAARPR